MICSALLAPASTANRPLPGGHLVLPDHSLAQKFCQAAPGASDHFAVAMTTFLADCQAAPLAPFSSGSLHDA